MRHRGKLCLQRIVVSTIEERAFHGSSRNAIAATAIPLVLASLPWSIANAADDAPARPKANLAIQTDSGATVESRRSVRDEIAPGRRISRQKPESEPATLRFGRNDGYDRLVFEWSSPVEVEVTKANRELVITFDRRAEAPPPPASDFTYRTDEARQLVFEMRSEDGGRRYRATIDPDVRVEVGRSNDDRLVIIDLFPESVDTAETESQPVTPAPLLAPAPEPEEDSAETLPAPIDEAAEADEPDEMVDAEDAGDREDVVDDSSADEGDDDLFEIVLGLLVEFSVATAENDLLSGDGDRGYAFRSDAEFYIDAYTDLRGDLEAGISVTLEAEADGDSEDFNADETYVYFFDGFGDIQLGRTEGAEDDMALGAATIAAGTGGIDGDTSNLGEVEVETSGDAAKISYYTPRMVGFQFGASYTPDTGDNEDGIDDGVDLENHVGVGLNYVENFGDAEIGLATVGSFGDSESSSADDLSAYSLGGTLIIDPIAIGASVGHVEVDDDFDFATLGVTVDIGESSAGLGYNIVDDDNDGITHVFVLSGDAPILPGVELQGDVSLSDPENDSGNVASVLAVELTY